MHPSRFILHQPASVQEVLALKQRYGDSATFYSGGTELLIALKARVLHYEHVIDIKRVPELGSVRLYEDRGILSIGARCTHHTLANDPIVREHLPGYAELSEQVANIRVRVAGSLGGVLCFGEPHADAPTMLCALDAQLVLAGAGGERRIASRDFHLGEFSTAREEDELLLAIEVPRQSRGTRSAYRCFRQTERPAVGVAAAWSTDGPQRLSLWAGAIGSAPIRLAQAENAAGQVPRDLSRQEVWETIRPALAAEAESIEAYDDLHGSADYKRHLVTVLAQRAIDACLP
jgi:carbon-monoxide dehydrogenase medium subunit